MAVKYSVVQQKYDITGQNILKFFAKAQASGQTDFASICETISDRGTVTKGDVMASIDGCIFAMKTALKEGLFQDQKGAHPVPSRQRSEHYAQQPDVSESDCRGH